MISKKKGTSETHITEDTFSEKFVLLVINSKSVASGGEIWLPRLLRLEDLKLSLVVTHMIGEHDRACGIQSVSFFGKILKMALIWDIIPKLLLLNLVYPLLVQKLQSKAVAWADGFGFPESPARPKPWSSCDFGPAWPGPRLEARPCTSLLFKYRFSARMYH
jgi:hypothetical protein